MAEITITCARCGCRTVDFYRLATERQSAYLPRPAAGRPPAQRGRSRLPFCRLCGELIQAREARIDAQRDNA
jgi:hypothetical protein